METQFIWRLMMKIHWAMGEAQEKEILVWLESFDFKCCKSTVCRAIVYFSSLLTYN